MAIRTGCEVVQRIKVVVAEALGRRVKDLVRGRHCYRCTCDERSSACDGDYTVFGDQLVQAEAAKGAEKAKGVLRQEVGRNITVRLTLTWGIRGGTRSRWWPDLEELLRDAKNATPEVAGPRGQRKARRRRRPLQERHPQDVEPTRRIDEEDLDLIDEDDVTRTATVVQQQSQNQPKKWPAPLGPAIPCAVFSCGSSAVASAAVQLHIHDRPSGGPRVRAARRRGVQGAPRAEVDVGREAGGQHHRLFARVRVDSEDPLAERRGNVQAPLSARASPVGDMMPP